MTLQIDYEKLKKELVNLIRLCSSSLPLDVIKAIKHAEEQEGNGTSAKNVFNMILQNIELAKEQSTPICQDTGTNIYYISHPVGVSTQKLTQLIQQATAEATEKSFLRPNAVDSITGKNSGNNLGVMSPYIHFDEWDKDDIEFKLMLKGGGSENVSAQYKLPNAALKAGRDLKGVFNCVVDAVNQAQGLGCAPGVIGVGIGGDRATSMITAKKQLFRKIDDTNQDKQMAELESKLLQDLNRLGIGPMGFGGKTTVLGVKAGHLHRLPASFFVSIAYMCWACRRKTLTVGKGEYLYD